MKKIILLFLLGFGLPHIAYGQRAVMENVEISTGARIRANRGFIEGSTITATGMITAPIGNFTNIQLATTSLRTDLTATQLSTGTLVRKSGDTMTGNLIVGASVQASVIQLSDGTFFTSTTTLGGGGAGDNLGNHIATTTLDMAGFGVNNISSFTVVDTKNFFSHYRPVTIVNNSSIPLYDYQIRFVTDTVTAIGQGKMRVDGRDIRFFDSNDTLLNHWIEEGVNTSTTTFWLKMPFIASNSAITIGMFYGNPNMDTVLSPKKVFDLFEDCESGIDLTRWNMYKTPPHHLSAAVPWSVDLSSFQTGLASFSSSVTFHAQLTVLFTEVYSRHPLTADFWWASSSEPGFDSLSFAHNGLVPLTEWPHRISGERSWERRVVNVPLVHNRVNIMSWEFRRDHGGHGGLERVWVDNIRVYKTPVVGVSISVGEETDNLRYLKALIVDGERLVCNIQDFVIKGDVEAERFIGDGSELDNVLSFRQDPISRAYFSESPFSKYVIGRTTSPIRARLSLFGDIYSPYNLIDVRPTNHGLRAFLVDADGNARFFNDGSRGGFFEVGGIPDARGHYRNIILTASENTGGHNSGVMLYRRGPGQSIVSLGQFAFGDPYNASVIISDPSVFEGNENILAVGRSPNWDSGGWGGRGILLRVSRRRTTFGLGERVIFTGFSEHQAGLRTNTIAAWSGSTVTINNDMAVIGTVNFSSNLGVVGNVDGRKVSKTIQSPIGTNQLTENIFRSSGKVFISPQTEVTYALPSIVTEITNVQFTQVGENVLNCFVNVVSSNSFTIRNDNLTATATGFWMAIGRE